jgi:adenosylcobinamide-GDP ribazoletransferase
MTLDEAWLKQRANDLRASILFLTRLRYGPALPVEGTAIAQGAWAFPIAGLLVGLIGAAVYLLVHRMGLPSWPAAALSVAATMAATGCLHEDGLADTTDGFGGGQTRELKLDIMRDSRIGAFGVCALVLSILLRVSALASLADTGLVVPALIASHSAARSALPVFMYFVPPARREGLSASAGQPPREGVIAAAVLGVLIVTLCLGPVLAIAALILLVAIIALLAWLSLAQIDGQTGDVVGALEQICEIAILLVALR